MKLSSKKQVETNPILWIFKRLRVSSLSESPLFSFVVQRIFLPFLSPPLLVRCGTSVSELEASCFFLSSLCFFAFLSLISSFSVFCLCLLSLFCRLRVVPVSFSSRSCCLLLFLCLSSSGFVFFFLFL